MVEGVLDENLGDWKIDYSYDCSEDAYQRVLAQTI